MIAVVNGFSSVEPIYFFFDRNGAVREREKRHDLVLPCKRNYSTTNTSAGLTTPLPTFRSRRSSAAMS